MHDVQEPSKRHVVEVVHGAAHLAQQVPRAIHDAPPCPPRLLPPRVAAVGAEHLPHKGAGDESVA